MAVTYRRWDADDSVSAQWFTVLDAARKAGVSFLLNDGHRTMAEQQVLFETVQARRSRLRPSPARPLRTSAPGGRTTRSTSTRVDGGAGRLAAWLRRRGARATFPVPGEAWHIEVPREDLVRLAGTLADPLAGYPAKERHWIRAYDALMRLKREGKDPADGPERRSELRRVMTNRRKSIWRAAQQSGWSRMRRRARYRSLLARTRNHD